LRQFPYPFAFGRGKSSDSSEQEKRQFNYHTPFKNDNTSSNEITERPNQKDEAGNMSKEKPSLQSFNNIKVSLSRERRLLIT
jgi:hypothetical protein